jgi:hypothetical protein
MAKSWKELTKSVKRIHQFNPNMPIVLMAGSGMLFDLERVEMLHHDSDNGLVFDIKAD